MSAIILPDTYIPPFYLANGHFQTIVPHLVLSKKITYRRQRITLADSDFIDLDWLDGGNNLLVLCHGLEGDSQSAYMTEMATLANSQGFTVLAWNYRGCSDTDNLSERMYHSGATSDLEEVLLAVKDLSPWQGIYLVGFSLGGNMLMKFIGELETGKRSPHLQISTIKGIAALSAAFDVLGTSEVLGRPENFIYQNRFLITLKQKLRRKQKNNLLSLSTKTINSIESIWEFDELYTAPTNGFGSAAEYYQYACALPYLPLITIPCLIVSAYNDPILSEACFPSSESLPANVSVCYTAEGGHVSYWDRNRKFWALHQILGFFLHQIEPLE
jgi:predicted alpha/beta-fold hydrolase